jgi:putative transposase
MSRTGNCWDHAVAESFFATLEHALIEKHDWGTHTLARRDIFLFIDEWSTARGSTRVWTM